MEQRTWFDRNSRGILRTVLLVLVCFGSAWVGGSFSDRKASASVPDYMRSISDGTKAIAAELKQVNRYLKDMEDSIDRIQRRYTK